MSDKISAEMILKHGFFHLPVLSFPGYYPTRIQGLQGHFSPKMIPKSYIKSIYPSTTAKGVIKHRGHHLEKVITLAYVGLERIKVMGYNE